MNKTRLSKPLVSEKNLNEFLYTVIMDLSVDQKKALPDRLRKHINTAKRAQNFVTKSNTDQKRELLSYLNLGSFFVIAPVGVPGNKQFENVISEFKNGNIQSGIREAVRSNIFVSADKEFTFCLGGMSQSMSGVPYIQNLELKRAGNILKKWPKKIVKNEEDDNDSMSEVVAKMLLWSGINWEQTEVAVGLTSDQIKVLYFLYINRNRYVSKDKINNFFTGVIGEQKIAATFKILLDNLYIQKHFDFRLKEYTITKLGIRTLNQFRDRVLKSFNF